VKCCRTLFEDLIFKMCEIENKFSEGELNLKAPSDFMLKIGMLLMPFTVVTYCYKRLLENIICCQW